MAAPRRLLVSGGKDISSVRKSSSGDRGEMGSSRERESGGGGEEDAGMMMINIERSMK